MSASTWQQAWDLAQPRLQTIRETLPSFPRGHARVLRVGLLDAELLDAELLQILAEPVAKAIGLIHSSYGPRVKPELTLLVHLLLYKFSIWDLGTTYGAKLQNLRYDSPGAITSQHLSPSGLPQRTLCAHATATILIPYLHSRLHVYALSRAWPDAPSSDIRRKAWNVLTRLESIHSALNLANFMAFLCYGRYRTWADRLLRLRLVPSQSTSTRQVSYEFMNRQMVWHAFTEFLLFFLPLINTRVLRRRISRAVSQISSSKIVPSLIGIPLGMQEAPSIDKENSIKWRGKYWSLPENHCAICAEDGSFNIIDPRHEMYTPNPEPAADESPKYPIHTPYITSCLHQYCYVCLSERMLRAADDGERGWECLRCEALVLSADRFSGNGTTESGFENLDLDLASLESEDFLTTTSE
ncbi:hypothetical protein K439DRAFT_1650253 [Ramaria rubella]|nr:hypothetical protein K439DRAFT_1650253 [Ramaria rubella]